MLFTCDIKVTKVISTWKVGFKWW